MSRPNATVLPSGLATLFIYAPESGDLQWRASASSQVPAGRLAGYVDLHGYRRVRIAGRSYSAHRIAWAIVHGAWPVGEIDHLNGDKSDNRLSNLRDVSKSVNGHNSGPRHHNTSGFRGVTRGKDGGWTARIQVDGRRLSLGTFDTPEEASFAYSATASELMGQRPCAANAAR